MVSAPLLISDYSGIPLARPPTPILEEKEEKVAVLNHFVVGGRQKQLQTQLSFDFGDPSKYFKRKKNQLVKKLSEPTLFDVKRLKPEAVSKLLKFKEIISKRLKRRYPSKVDSIISLDGLFGDNAVLLVSSLFLKPKSSGNRPRSRSKGVMTIKMWLRLLFFYSS